MAQGVPIEPMVVEPVTLEGQLVRLEPLSRDHLADLTDAATDPTVWRWMPERNDTPELMASWLDRATMSGGGTQLPFATIERSSGRAVGSTRYLAIEPSHRRLEIGWTWLARQARGHGLNDEAKLLLLRHAFEVLGCQRVEFKTDARNQRSRGALDGIGATHEGVFHKHMINHDDSVRDSAWYRVVDDDWPTVERHLVARLASHLAPSAQAAQVAQATEAAEAAQATEAAEAS